MIKLNRFPLFVVPLAVLSSAGLCDSGFAVDDTVTISAPVDSDEDSYENSGTKAPCSNERLQDNKDRIKSFAVKSVSCSITEVRSPDNTASTFSGTATVGSQTATTSGNVQVGAVDCGYTAEQLNIIAQEIKATCEANQETAEANIPWAVNGTCGPADCDPHFTLQVTVEYEAEVSF